MILKLKKKNITFIFSLVLVVVLSFFTISKQSIIVSMHNSLEQVMAMDLGFSTPRNLTTTKYNEVGDHLYQSIPSKITSLVNSVPKILKYKLFNNNNYNFERLDIDIKFVDYLKIMSDRDKALKNNMLSTPTTVKALIRYKEREYKSKLRLKGDLEDHWTSRYRMSFRVKLKGKNTVQGFNIFSIHKPRARQYPYDYVFQKMVQDIGNLSSVHNFVHVFVNGDDWGIMGIEEHMSKGLLEKQRRKDSLIVRFSDDKKWLYSYSVSEPYPLYRLSDSSLNLHVYGAKKYLKDKYFRNMYSYISKYHRNFNPLLYDIDSFTKAYILANAWGEEHTLFDRNSRYYFNPYTLKLEPITTDQTPYKINPGLNRLPRQYLSVISSKHFSTNLAENINSVNIVVSKVDEYLNSAHKFFPVDKKKNGKIVLDNMANIISKKKTFLKSQSINNIDDNKSILSLPSQKQASEFSKHLHVKHYTDGSVELYNLLPDNVVVKNIFINGKKLLETEFVVPSYLSATSPYKLKTKFSGVHDRNVIVNSEYMGFEINNSNELSLIPVRKNYNPLLRDTTVNFSFINKTKAGNYIISNGDWKVNTPLIVNGNLFVPSGVNLKFNDNAYLIVKGSLKIMGESLKPVILESLTKSWKGIYVLGSNNKSEFNNVVVRNATNLDDGLLKLTGAITFYNENIYFKNVRIENIKSEDAINIVKSRFSFDTVEIKNVSSDGLDSDFSTGTIFNSTLLNVGGDALDFSGSDVVIDRVQIKSVKDKAISSGEGSTVKVMNSTMSGVGVGIASKDGSKVIATDTTINDYQLHAVMSYLKKDFYSAPTVNIFNCKIGLGDAYVRQIGTIMTVDNIDIPEVELNVKELYKTKVMEK